jgi:hypothetical protein
MQIHALREERRDIYLPVLNLDARSRWVDNATPRPFYFQRKIHGEVSPRAGPDANGEEKTFCP